MSVVYKEVPKLCFISHEGDLPQVDCVGAEGARDDREPSESEQRRSETRAFHQTSRNQWKRALRKSTPEAAF